MQISGNRANNEVLLFDGAKWATEQPIYWGEGKSDVYAYYPYNPYAGNDPTAVKVKLSSEQSEASFGANDIKASISRQRGVGTTFDFASVLTLITFRINAVDSPLQDYTLKSVTLRAKPINEGDPTPVVAGDLTIDLTNGNATTFSEDGVDYVPMKGWKNGLINLLNIAGTGPIFGPIQGILFGPIAFITIPIGNVIGGAMHDYFSGMICLRDGGTQMPEMVRRYSNKGVFRVYQVFVCLLLLLVGAVFIYTPGDIAATQVFGFDGKATSVSTWVIYLIVFLILLILSSKRSALNKFLVIS